MSKHTFEPYYKNLSKLDAFNSGYFVPKHDKIDWKTHINLPCTPINFLDEINEGEKPAILISTGAHCPMHEGHISIMVNAKIAVEKSGYKVIGGYLSPGHDEYINEKLGSDAMNISKRMEWANKLILESRNSDWLSIDPWEGVFAPGAVNFTSVVYRLDQYIKKFYKHNVKIFFVCGDDNARFMIPFENSDIGTVIMKRPGYDEIRAEYKNQTTSDNVIFGISNINISSTIVRQTQKYKDFKNDIRPKQAFARMVWNNDEKQTLTILKKFYLQVWPQDINEQKTQYLQNTTTRKPVINLDSETHTGIKLQVSRKYDLFGQKMLGYTNRPGSRSIDEQILEIKKTTPIENGCLLFDDDIFSGGTMNFIENKITSFGGKVEGRFSFLSGESNKHEVIDVRDFIFGYMNGGLVTEINNQLIRVPYIYPFVDPNARASISKPLDFSIDMWNNSMKHYNKLEPIYIGDHTMFQFLMKFGFKHDTTMEEVCRYYRDFLETITKYK